MKPDQIWRRNCESRLKLTSLRSPIRPSHQATGNAEISLLPSSLACCSDPYSSSLPRAPLPVGGCHGLIAVHGLAWEPLKVESPAFLGLVGCLRGGCSRFRVGGAMPSWWYWPWPGGSACLFLRFTPLSADSCVNYCWRLARSGVRWNVSLGCSSRFLLLVWSLLLMLVVVVGFF